MILSVGRIADVVMHGDSTLTLLTWQTMPLDAKKLLTRALAL